MTERETSLLFFIYIAIAVALGLVFYYRKKWWSLLWQLYAESTLFRLGWNIMGLTLVIAVMLFLPTWLPGVYRVASILAAGCSAFLMIAVVLWIVISGRKDAPIA